MLTVLALTESTSVEECPVVSQAKIMGNYPNTYTLTKSIAENLLVKYVVAEVAGVKY